MYKGFFKRLIDILVSFTAICVLLPVYLILIVLVAIFLGRPVFFRQVRPGRDNKLFSMWKFRTMTNQKDKNGDLLPDEKRLTKFGRFLRSVSLDELPQLWNILKGDMSIVGPRPQLVQDMVFFDEKTNLRQTVTPGLTGYAQIKGRNNVDWDEKFENDLEYIQKITFFKDLVIVFKTIGKVLSRKDVSPIGSPVGESYCDWLLKKGRITQDEYNLGVQKAKDMIDEFKRNK